jgi:hypothetical protein
MASTGCGKKARTTVKEGGFQPPLEFLHFQMRRTTILLSL